MAVGSPYLVDPGLEMALSGDWETGGVLELFLDGELKQCLQLSPAPWSVLANLLLAAIRAQATHWIYSFVKTKDLAESLQARGVVSLGLNDKVHKLVSKIRSTLASTEIRKGTADAELSGKAWAECLIQSQKPQGYRVGLPAKNLKLFIGEKSHQLEPTPRSEWEGREEPDGRKKECPEDGRPNSPR